MWTFREILVVKTLTYTWGLDVSGRTEVPKSGNGTKSRSHRVRYRPQQGYQDFGSNYDSDWSRREPRSRSGRTGSIVGDISLVVVEVRGPDWTDLGVFETEGSDDGPPRVLCWVFISP